MILPKLTSRRRSRYETDQYLDLLLVGAGPSATALFVRDAFFAKGQYQINVGTPTGSFQVIPLPFAVNFFSVNMKNKNTGFFHCLLHQSSRGLPRWSSECHSSESQHHAPRLCLLFQPCHQLACWGRHHRPGRHHPAQALLLLSGLLCVRMHLWRHHPRWQHFHCQIGQHGFHVQVCLSFFVSVKSCHD